MSAIYIPKPLGLLCSGVTTFTLVPKPLGLLPRGAIIITLSVLPQGLEQFVRRHATEQGSNVANIMWVESMVPRKFKRGVTTLLVPGFAQRPDPGSSERHAAAKVGVRHGLQYDHDDVRFRHPTIFCCTRYRSHTW